MTRTAIRTCPLCEATCGLAIELDGDRVVSVRGDGQDVFSAGYLCPKGALLGDLDADPDRLRTPRIRRDGDLVEASWEEAFDLVATRLSTVRAEHGNDAVAIYLGNPNAHTLAGQLYNRPLIKALATRNVHSASSVDQLPKHISCGLLFGDPLAIPVPDIDRTEMLVILGGNPRVSNGSLMTAPDLPGRLTELRRRGGRLVVIDPKRTRTAARADEHLAIRPGTDVLLLAAIARTVFTEDLVAIPGHLQDHVVGLDEVAQTLAPFTPAAAAPACGIDASTIQRMAHDLVRTDGACVYGRLGTTATDFGTTTSWLVDVVNLITGNLDVPGGAMFPRPAHHRGSRRPFRMNRWQSRVTGLPEAIGELPVAGLIDEIETPGDGQVRALLTVGGNPVASTPDSERLDAAIGSLNLVISVDPYINATSRHADVILPPPSTLQRSHMDLSFAALSVRNVVNYSPPACALDPGQLDEWEILVSLAAIATGAPTPIDIDGADDVVAAQLAAGLVRDPAAATGDLDADALLQTVEHRRGPERLLDLLVRAGPYGDGFGAEPDGLTLAAIEARPHGIDLGPLTSRLPDALSTASGNIEVAAEAVLADLERARQRCEAAEPQGLVLIGRRHLRTNNSWSHNVAALTKGQDLCTLQVTPGDAEDAGLTDGDSVTVRSRIGSVTTTVEICEDLRQGVVSLPHGFGHDLAGVELAVACRGGGVNSNVLTDRHAVDPVSGNAVLNGIPVELTPAGAGDGADIPRIGRSATPPMRFGL